MKAAPIQAIAKQLQLPIEKIQQVAFRLMVVGLAEEVPWVAEIPAQTSYLDIEMLGADKKSDPVENAVSQSFLQNLVGFLKGKA